MDWGDCQHLADSLVKVFGERALKEPSRVYPLSEGVYTAAEIVESIQTGSPLGHEILAFAGVAMALGC